MSDNQEPRKRKSFVAVDEVEELYYNFKPFVDVEGPIPEPSSIQIRDFRNGFVAMFQESLPDDDTPKSDTDDDGKPKVTAETVKKFIIDVIGEDESELEEKTMQLIAAVCSDHPSFDELRELPYRHKQAFSGYIAGAFLFPQLLTTATNS